MILSNIEILEIRDTEKLLNMGVIEPATKNGINYTTINGEKFKRINIENDSVIHRFFCGAKLFKGKVSRYCHLTTIIRGDNNTNLQCYSVEDYYDYLAQIIDHLDQRYGIIVDVSDVRIKEIEINKTIELYRPFEEYHRPLQLMFQNLPHTFHSTLTGANRDSAEDRQITRSYSARTNKTPKSKHYMICSIYDKSKQLEQKITIEKNYLRLEIRLVGASKIKRELGTDSFAELTDELLCMFLQEQIEKLFVKPHEKWEQSRDKLLSRIIKEERKKNKHWIVNTLRRLQDLEIQNQKPYVLDIHEILLVFSIISDDTKKRQNEIIKQFLEQANKYEKSMVQNDHDKIEELFEKLTQ